MKSLNIFFLFFALFSFSSKGYTQNFCNSVVYVLNPDCKLCQYKTFDMQETLKLSMQNDIKIYFVFHKGINKKKAKRFINMFSDKKFIKVYYDDNNEVTNRLKVNTTPSVLLFDKQCNNIYFGAIDDKDISLQKSKTDKTISYIDAAIKSYLNNEKIEISCTTPIGCIFK